MNKSMKKFIIVCVVFVAIAFGLRSFFKSYVSEEGADITSNNTIVHLDMDAVIWNGKKFIKNLKDYREKTGVKAFLLDINSPGGAVGPSQEIFAEIKRTREEFKIPVICVTTGVMASGAYYAAAACDKIVVAPGALIGSIGVIMEFANLEKLYDWAKVSRYSITSGKYKDSGAEYRNMREDERVLFQDMINEVYGQFRNTVMEARGIKDQVMDDYADGRVFTGLKAVEIGFADVAGTYEDAVKLAAKTAELGDDFEVFEIPKKKRSLFDWGSASDDDNVNTITQQTPLAERVVGNLLSQVLGIPSLGSAMHAQSINQPMYILPGALRF